MEIERKFRLASPPAIELGEGSDIAQGYLPAARGELRLRRMGERCFLTVKGDGTLAREEWETEIPRWVFEQLWPQTEDARVEKVRHAIPAGPYVLELDLYRGALAGLVILECEFPDAGAAARAPLPAWAEGAAEVTDDPAFKNRNLARHGLPPG